VIVLYFGKLCEDRYVLELANIAQTFPERWTLVLHGWGSASLISDIRRCDARQKVALSLALVPGHELVELVASADVGLAFYSAALQNDRLSAFASEKVATYLQCGVPFVAFDYPGYRYLADKDRCGVVIQDLSELPQAISTILTAHEAFRHGAHKAFTRHYDYARNFRAVIDWLEGL